MEKELVGKYAMPGIGFGTLGNVGDAGCALVEAALAEGYHRQAAAHRVSGPGRRAHDGISPVHYDHLRAGHVEERCPTRRSRRLENG
jgi:hypothetical protein